VGGGAGRPDGSTGTWRTTVHSTGEDGYELSEDGSLVRRYRSFDPDMSSREYRETYTLEPDGSRLNTIEYRDDDGAWQPWRQGPFRSVRYSPLAGPAAPAGADS
jgi:hypothetical protein